MSSPEDQSNEQTAAQPPPRFKRADIVLACVVIAVVLFYFVWRSGGFSSGANSAPPAQSAIDHKALIQDESFHILQGMAYGDAGMLEQAIFEEKEAYRINPRSMPALNNLGFYLFKAGLYAESAAVLEEALKLEPASQLVQNNLRNTYQKAIETGNDAQKETFRQRKERLEAGTLLAPPPQSGQGGTIPKK